MQDDATVLVEADIRIIDLELEQDGTTKNTGNNMGWADELSSEVCENPKEETSSEKSADNLEMKICEKVSQ